MNLSEEVRPGLCFRKTTPGAACGVRGREQAANSPGRGGEGPTRATAGE